MQVCGKRSTDPFLGQTQLGREASQSVLALRQGLGPLRDPRVQVKGQRLQVVLNPFSFSDVAGAFGRADDLSRDIFDRRHGQRHLNLTPIFAQAHGLEVIDALPSSDFVQDECLFGPEKDFSKLLEYEWRLEECLQGQPALSGICQYHADTLPAEVLRHGLVTHPSFYISETLSRLNPHYVDRDAFTPQTFDRSVLDETINDLYQEHDSH